jgi:hypothetical protein
MPHRAYAAAWSAALATGLSLTAAATSPTTASAETPPGHGCFAAGGGYLRARLRGAVVLDLDWKNAELECAGGPRPPNANHGRGIRVSIAGPDRGDGRRVRIVFGIAGPGEGESGETLATNVTVLFEGEQRIFATQGDDKCTVDSLSQQRVEKLTGPHAVYRVVGRGFCLGPATSLTRGERVFLTSFDFAGRVEFNEDDRDVPTSPSDHP